MANITPCILPSLAQGYKPYVRPQAICLLWTCCQLTVFWLIYRQENEYFSKIKIVYSFLNICQFVKLSGRIFSICCHIPGYREHVPIPHGAIINRTNRRMVQTGSKKITAKIRAAGEAPWRNTNNQANRKTSACCTFHVLSRTFHRLRFSSHVCATHVHRMCFG